MPAAPAQSASPIRAIGVRRSFAFGPHLIAFDHRVLRPRLWTVMQSDWAVELSMSRPPGPILELFAGVGHIGLLAADLTGRSLVQVEADSVAASFAAVNAERAGLFDRVDVRRNRVDNALTESERFPLVIADPPYLRTADVNRFPEDPVVAIDGGEDGLDLVRVTLDVVAAHMTAGGACLLQLAGPSQVAAARRLVHDGWPMLAVTASRAVDFDRAVALITRR